MSAKVKLISFISAFVLVLGIMIIGVLSAEQVKVNIGGSVSFNATNVYAKVSGNISRAQTGNKTFSTLTYSAEETTGDESDWTKLDLEFTETPDPIVITITVENLSTQRTLTVNLENTLQGEGLDIAVTRDSGAYASGTNFELPVSTGDGSSTTTFTLSLTVANPDEDLTNVTFGYILNMYDESSVPVDLSAFTFTTSGSNATLTSYTGTDAEVVIPSTISLTPDGTAIEGSDYTVTAIAAGSGSSGPFYSVQSTLTSITIPETMETIGNYAFYNCTALTEINYNATNVSDLSSGNRVFYNAGQDGTGITVNIGPNVTRLPNYIFCPVNNNSYSPNITTVNFAEGSVCESIGSYAFQYCRSLTSITIPEGVTSIGSYAFRDCSSLTSIIIPEGVTSIGSYALRGCNSLTSITIPSSVTSIGNYAFYNCRALTEINYNATNVRDLPYDNYVFYKSGQGGDGITVNIGANVTKIPNYIFYPNSGNSPNITTVNFAEGSVCESIGKYAFQYCRSLTSITIPDSITSIGSAAFQACSSLTSITIPDSVTSIGDVAFSNCSSLTSITIPDSVTSIGDSTFIRCSNLTSITIPEGVTSIGPDAFTECSSLTSITIPDSVTSIGNGAFYNCYALAEVYNYSNLTITAGSTSNGWLGYDAKVVYNASDLTGEKPETRIKVVGNVQYYSYGEDFIALAPTSRNVAEATLDNRTTEINQHAFEDCYSLTSITIPSSVTSIGNYAFEDCYALAEVYNYSPRITVNLGETSSFNNGYLGQYAKVVYNARDLTGEKPETMITVVDNMQYYNYRDDFIALAPSVSRGTLTEVTLDSRTTEINQYAFNGCSNLTSITIPDSVTSIGSSAFSSCSRLTRITINATTPPTLGSSAIPSNVTNIYVPAESVEAYKEANGWSRYKSKISAIVNN